VKEKYGKGEGKTVPVSSINPRFYLPCQPLSVRLFGIAFDRLQIRPIMADINIMVVESVF